MADTATAVQVDNSNQASASKITPLVKRPGPSLRLDIATVKAKASYQSEAIVNSGLEVVRAQSAPLSAPVRPSKSEPFTQSVCERNANRQSIRSCDKCGTHTDSSFQFCKKCGSHTQEKDSFHRAHTLKRSLTARAR